MKFLSRGIGSWNYRIILEFDMRFGSSTDKKDVKLQRDQSILNINMVILRDIILW